MRSIKFPRMFTGSSTVVTKAQNYLEATKQNLKLLLETEKGELFGDPYFGIRCKRFQFEPNSPVLADILADEIYTQLALFMPQLKVERKNIKVARDPAKGLVYCTIRALNQIDFTTNTFNLVLYDQNT